MALSFQNVPLIFGSGIDRTDPYLLPSGKLTTLQNMVFEDAQTVITRAGLYGLSLAPAVPSIPSPYTRTNPSFTGTPYRMSQNQGSLLLEGENGLFSKAPYDGNQGGVDGADVLQIRTDTGTTAGGRPDFVRASVETSYVGTVNSPSKPASLIALVPLESMDFGRIEDYDTEGNSMSLWAWVENQPGSSANYAIHMRAFVESPSGANSQVLDLSIPITAAQTANIRVLTSSTDFYVLAMNCTTGVISIPLQLTASTGAVAYPTYTATATTNFQTFDAVIEPTNGRICLAYRNGATSIRMSILNAGASAEASGATITTTAGIVQISLVNFIYSGTNYICALYTCSGSTDTIRGATISSAGTPDIERAVYSGLPGAVGRIVAIDTDTTSSDFTVFCDIADLSVSGDANVYQFTTNKVTLAGTLVSNAVGLARNAYIYARPQSAGTRIQLPVCYIDNPLYPTIFVIQATVGGTGYPASYSSGVPQKTVITARIHPGYAGNINYSWFYTQRLPSTFKNADGTLVLLATRFGAQTTAAAGEPFAQTQVWKAVLNYTSQDLGFAESSRNTYLAGSCPQTFDGAYFEETGFNHPPYPFSAVASGSGGNLTAGTYQVCATYFHVDAHGNAHESAPSEIVEMVATAGQKYTPTVGNYGITSKQNVQIRIYRSEADRSTLYLDNSVANTLSSGITDTGITANTRIYTDGGWSPNQPMPACRVITEHQNRLWCAGGEDGTIIYFSHAISQDLEPEWNRLLKRTVPRNAGRVVNIVSLDDKLVVFCENRIGFIYGDGPNRAGQQDGYSQFIEAVSGYSVPWNEPHSIVRATDGVWFRCGFGFRLLGRNMAVVKDSDGSDLGSSMDAALVGDRGAANGTVVRALVSSTAQQVRFYMSDATVYVYDMIYGQWSQFTGFSAVDCAAIGDDYYHISNTPELFVQNKTAVYDSSGYGQSDTAISSTFTTGWLSFAGLQGFQRVSRVMLLAQLPTADAEGYTLTVQAAYNFVDATYTTLYSGPFLRVASGSTVLQLEMQPTVQKCESLRLKITVVPTDVSGDGTRPLRLTAANLVVGLKKGRYTLASTSKV